MACKKNIDSRDNRDDLAKLSLPVDAIRRLEEKAKQIGLEEWILIENASSNLFSAIDALNMGSKVLVVAGRGNNGADVLSCARKLASRGYKTAVVTLEEKPLGKESCSQKLILEAAGIKVKPLTPDNIDSLRDLTQECEYILEGILGIGLKGEVSPFYKKVIRIINGSAKTVVSCDIPSGLSPDGGIVLGEAVKADYTVTFIAPKNGFFVNQGPSCCGKIYVVDIGISREILESITAQK
ncbi:MAG: NAD(P)H-hydrate epimerase [Candidatus Omnitrophota bacterium]